MAAFLYHLSYKIAVAEPDKMQKGLNNDYLAPYNIWRSRQDSNL